MYDRKCRNLSSKEIEKRIESGEEYVIRMKVPKNQTVKFTDKVFGDISVETNTIDDQVLIKTDGFPTYHFAVVVDDHLMKISHIFRGEDWLPSTPKHILLYKFFGWKLPKFVHLPNVLGENKKKLSKRQGAVSVEYFKEKGYLQEALINFLALLGWNSKSNQELMTKNELIEKFSIAGLHKAGAIFNYQKLDWVNSQYLKNKSNEEILEKSEIYLNNYFEKNKIEKDLEKIDKIITTEKTRIKKLSDLTENFDVYFKDIDYDVALLKWKNMTSEELKKALEVISEIISKADLSSPELFQKIVLEKIGKARGEHLWPLRVALSGQEKSASPFELAWILGKEASLKRIGEAITKIN
jgi:glutamyl-tRNA synthetase